VRHVFSRCCDDAGIGERGGGGFGKRAPNNRVHIDTFFFIFVYKSTLNED
jgi:hypothetical protein